MTDETQKIESAVKAIIAEALREAAEALTSGTTLPSDLVEPGDVTTADKPAAVGSTKPYPGSGYADFYFCGCIGLNTLSRRIGVTCFKAGASQQGVLIRQQDLARDSHAGTVRHGDGFKLERGWDSWEMRQIHPIDLPAGSAVAFVSRAMRIKLSVPFAVFEKNLRREMKPFALHEWIKTPAGKKHLAARGVAVAEVERFTIPMFGDDPRMPPDRATELYMLKPRTDLPKVVVILDRCAKTKL